MALHEKNLFVSEDHLRTYFSKYGVVSDLSPIGNETGVATGDFGIAVALNRGNFMEVSNTLMCEGRLVCVVVIGASPTFLGLWDCWAFVEGFPGAAVRGER